MPVAQSAGAWLHWRAAGPREAVAEPEPVLLIMGLAASSRMWWRLEPHITRRHRAILFDNRGTGDSDRVRGPLSMADMVADAVAVLDAAGEATVHVVGASMGGMIAQHLALEHPERVRSLVLACTTAGGSRGAPPWRLLATTALRPLLGPQRTFPLIAPALYSRDGMRRHPERLREDLRRRTDDATPAATTYAQLAAAARHDTRARLQELGGIPTLVLHGAQDSLVPPEQGRLLAERIPGARLVFLPSCGHVLTTDAEEAVSKAVLEHLEGAARRSSRAA